MSGRPNLWDSFQASTRKAMNQAGDAAQVAAQKTKLRADILLLDRDISSRKQKFGVEMYTHLEATTSTQEFYVAEDRLINVLRPTLIKTQKEVAAYERKRDALKAKVNAAEARRVGSKSVIGAATFSEKFKNAANFASAGATEARLKTEMLVIERQILGFKEDYGKELYPVFKSMEDNEGWLPTDRKVRFLYDAAREDISNLEKKKDEKETLIVSLGESGGSQFTPPAPSSTPGVPVSVALGAPVQMSASQSASAAVNNSSFGVAYGTGNGAAQHSAQNSYEMQSIPASTNQTTGFGFMQSQNNGITAPAPPAQAGFNNTNFQQPNQQQPSNTSVFNEFDAISGTSAGSTTYAPTNNNAGDYAQQSTVDSQVPSQMNSADMNLFKY